MDPDRLAIHGRILELLLARATVDELGGGGEPAFYIDGHDLVAAVEEEFGLVLPRASMPPIFTVDWLVAVVEVSVRPQYEM